MHEWIVLAMTATDARRMARAMRVLTSSPEPTPALAQLDVPRLARALDTAQPVRPAGTTRSLVDPSGATLVRRYWSEDFE